MKKLLRGVLVFVAAAGLLILDKTGIKVPEFHLGDLGILQEEDEQTGDSVQDVFTYLQENSVPEYEGNAFVEIHGNLPFFNEAEYVTESFERYEKLDRLGRCGTAYACIGQEIMPSEEREAIGQIKPSGWHTVKYPDVIPDRYLYNRCHLIAFSLAGENANEKNLITGTRYMNIEGMLPFEIKVAEYAETTGNHVLYRVTPVFAGNNLVADGVIMEAYSVEDKGEGICFCVYAYNVQPGIEIDYRTGESRLE